jgi:hypothetical protein
VHGGHADQAPRTVKLYVNRDVDFDGVEAAVATHTINMPSTMSDEAEFPLSLDKFNNVGSLSLFVSDTFGGSVCRLQYVGLKGTFLAPKVSSCRLHARLYVQPQRVPLCPPPPPPPLLPCSLHSRALAAFTRARAQVRVGAIKNAVYEAKPQLQGAPPPCPLKPFVLSVVWRDTRAQTTK